MFDQTNKLIMNDFGPNQLETIKVSKEFLALAAHDLQVYQKSI